MAHFDICLERYFPQHFLYFLPLSHGHGSFRPIFGLDCFALLNGSLQRRHREFTRVLL